MEPGGNLIRWNLSAPTPFSSKSNGPNVDIPRRAERWGEPRDRVAAGAMELITVKHVHATA